MTIFVVVIILKTCFPCIGSFGHNCSSPCPDGYFGHGCRLKFDCNISESCEPEIGCTIRYSGDNKTESKTNTDLDNSGRKTTHIGLLSGCSLIILTILIGIFLKYHRILLSRCRRNQENGDCREGNTTYDSIEPSLVIDNPVSTSLRNYTVPRTIIIDKNAKTDAERKSSGLCKQDIVIKVENVNKSTCNHKRDADKSNQSQNQS